MRIPFGNLTLLASIAALAAAGCEQPLPKAQGRHVDERHGYSIELPEGWELESREAGALLCALGPLETDDDSFRENVTVAVETLGEPGTLEDYTAAALAIWSETAGFTQHESGPAKLGQHDARRIVHSQRVEDLEVKILTYVVVRERSAWLIHCTAEPAKFDRYRETFDKAVASFRLEPPQGAVPATQPQSASAPASRPSAR